MLRMVDRLGCHIGLGIFGHGAQFGAFVDDELRGRNKASALVSHIGTIIHDRIRTASIGSINMQIPARREEPPPSPRLTKNRRPNILKRQFGTR